MAVRAANVASESSNGERDRQLPTAQRSKIPIQSSELAEDHPTSLLARLSPSSLDLILGSLDRWMVGSCQNAGLLTVTVSVARPSLPLVFEAQQLTTVLPIANVDPERGRQ